MSLAVPFSVTVPASGEPGSVRLPVGLTVSTKKAAWCPTQAEELAIAAGALVVVPAVGIGFVADAIVERLVTVMLACCMS